ncbi:intermembrane phospholipid transport protein YdbH family protein [Brevundimonas sp. Root1279]|uniref:intermembrane phospholipid transport protein YdbH family protein n=1 Tax=Brevundimonas sp. Root1279 TaxID=1736443 RepID=UPI0007014310|nr:YdbH domain-containing protein [Brevundimonas sp. Root1279]KQW81981.1 C4-dicarboxylate ABC transporter [Brevundimonas sp. Root1279]
MSDVAEPDQASSVSPTPCPTRPRGGGGRLLLLVAGVILCVLLVLAGLLYLNRRAAARQVLVGWLERQGVEADLEIEKVELDGVIARIRIGDPRNPDVVVERVEVDYAVGAPWSKEGLGVTPSRIRLLRPVLRASWRDGKLSLGSLDPLIEQFKDRPPRPDQRGPLVLVEQGRVRLDTEYGVATILGDARVDNGELVRLSARMPAANLKSGATEANALSAALELTTTGDRVAVRGAVFADQLTTPGAQGAGARLTFVGDLPYPDLKQRRGDGVARVDADLVADRLAFGDTAAEEARISLDFNGKTTGWIETFVIEGQADAELAAARIDAPDLDSAAPTVRWNNAQAVLTRDDEGLAWRLEGPVRAAAGRASAAGLQGSGVALTSNHLTLGGRGAAVEAFGPVGLAADRLVWDDMVLSGARGTADFELVSDTGLRLTADGGLRAAHGAWPLFGPSARDDAPELAAMKRALGDFAVDIPAFTLVSSGGGTRLALARPATLRPANGGVLTVSPGAGPIFSAQRGQMGGGALALAATRGEGLPEAAFNIPDWRLTPGGFQAVLDGRAALDFDLARDITVTTRGELASNNGRLTYVAADCAPVTVGRLELDENDVTDISGSLCPVAAPLVTVTDGAWRAEGGLSDLDAAVPFLALDVRDARGEFVATGGPRGLGLDARIARARLVDATEPTRFHPVAASGRARLVGEDWTGEFDLAHGETSLGRLSLAHDGARGAGGLNIDVPSLVFAEGGLQPDDLSPLAADFVGSPAIGSVSFRGRVDWLADAEGSSSGVLDIPRLDFVSPVGPVKGLTGTVQLTSLAPLTTAPGQYLTAESLDTAAPVTDLDVTFALDKAAITIEGGDVDVAGGLVKLEPFALPFDRAQPYSGVLVLENVQLGEVIAGSGFRDKVVLDAVVSGRLPFTNDPEHGLRVVGGSLSAVRPGRLSIGREALSGLEAGGGGAGVPPNTVQDLAYQAMENLSFDVLSAEVNSLEQGRLSVLFRIRGRHDPPQHQELRVSIADLISREFLNRQLPLPSGTGIDLTLDTTLNVNELISDLMALNRARAGQPDPDPAP